MYQDFKELEYIVIDGDSIDGSQDVIKSMIISFGNSLKWISEPDRGIYEAMNKGIRKASGKYILFLNSGDFLVESYVISEIFRNPHNAELLTGNCRISDKGNVVHITSIPKRITFGYLYFTGLPHQSTFIRKDLFLKYGLYREDFLYNSDIEFWYRTIVFQNCTIETVNTIISDYNLEGISSTQRQSERYKKEMTEILNDYRLQFYLPDYDSWVQEKSEMEGILWAYRKKPLRKMMTGIYHLACFIIRIRKSVCAG